MAVWIVARFFAALENACAWIGRLVSWVGHETLWRISSPEAQYLVNRRLYEGEKDYFPGSDFFKRGLFDWEKNLLANDAFPKQGRILLFAAGCGREAEVLATMGYDVTALEPNPTFFRLATDYFKNHPRIHFEPLSFATWTKALPKTQNFDGIMVGWGAFSYLFSENEQQGFLASLKKYFPQAPVLLSFLMLPYPNGLSSRLRHLIGGNRVGPHRVFLRRSGFTYLYTKPQIEILAGQCGYELSLFESQPYPHALLKPLV